MAETEKKEKAPAKPRAPRASAGTDGAETSKKAPAKTAAKKTAAKTTGADKASNAKPTHDEIAALARQYWAERGHQDGHAEQDWLRAERELTKKAS